ncbi:hypothetical protein SISSUDRAFT_396292 [Sistotremastrum suecicum HHB10207 ss-3]|uniref:F-box domain-containing protein n=1 Tax=Sistotremastrum suecicum HHB10207 ss-3 TaxID=1314776 RepID=A0A165YTY0_9AGAM|nr:hypothetical protein SISSUDRAFT_396292 [Sistotremastrum suecicum HHB10207 ss-3]
MPAFELQDVLQDASVGHLTEALLKKIRSEKDTALVSPQIDTAVTRARLRAAKEFIGDSILDTSIRFRQSLNRESTFLRLPEEIITHIISLALPAHNSSTGWDVDRYQFSLNQMRMQLAATHVCSGWRDICIQLSRVWRVIDLLWPRDIIRLFATRARASSLSLRLSTSYHDDSVSNECLRQRLVVASPFLIQNMSRMQHLELHLPLRQHVAEEESRELWNTLRHLPAPRLEKFHFTVPSVNEMYLSENLFSDQAPLLRDLALGDDCSISGLLPQGFQSLQKLSLNLSFKNAHAISFAHFPIMLSNLSALVDIDLYGDCQFREHIIPSLHTIGTLPDCTVLSITSFMTNQLIHFFSALKFPSLRRLQIHSIVWSDVDSFPTCDLYSALPPAFKTRFHDVEKLEFYIEDGGVRAYAETTSDCELDLSQTYDGRPENIATQNTIKHLLRAPARILNIRPKHLVFLCDDPLEHAWMSEDIWRKALSAYPSVERLSIPEELPLGPLISALDSEEEPVCPRLKILELETATSSDRNRLKELLGWDGSRTYMFTVVVTNLSLVLEHGRWRKVS